MGFQPLTRDSPRPVLRFRRFSRRASYVVTLAAIGLAAWAFWWEPRRLVVRDIGLNPACWEGPSLRIAIASDLHVGAPGKGLEELDALVARITALQPDLVVLLGDYVIQGVTGGRFVPPETIASRLGRLKPPLGVFAVLGNHDWWLDARRVEAALSSAGVRVLEDAAVRIGSAGDHFWLAGISDFWEGRHDVARALAAVADDRPVVAITHNPDVFPLVPSRVCLTLAGHTHGGQVALPWFGAPVVPSRYGQRYAAGHIREDTKELFVTTGVGTSIIPVRFRVPPELVVLTLAPNR